MEIVFAGFGGQGVLTAGLVTAHIAMKNGYEVLWSPAYGGEMRGGKAYSLVKFEREAILEPVITRLDALVAMNGPSLDFCRELKAGGVLLANSDTVSKLPEGFASYSVPADSLARAAGAGNAASLAALGALFAAAGVFARDSVEDMCEYFTAHGKGRYNETNRSAFLAGFDFIAERK